MGFAVPKPQDLFSDVAKDRGALLERFEAFKTAMGNIAKKSLSGSYGFEPGVGIVKRAGDVREAFSEIEKALSPDQLLAVSSALETAKSNLSSDIQKDWTNSNPLASGLTPYDLYPVLQMLVPRAMPIRNSIARIKGTGSAKEFRQITGVTNSGTGGVANSTTFFASDSASQAFGPVTLRRPNKISYAATKATASYKEQGVSDQVNFRAQFEGLGYTDLRTVSHTAGLWAHLLGEERNFLYGRGNDAGMTGATAAPTFTVAASGSLGTIPTAAGGYFVKVTSMTGPGQESLPGTEANTGAFTLGQNIVITLTGNPPAGVVAYGVYVQTVTNTEVFQGYFVPTGAAITLTSYATGGAVVPIADGSASALSFDGLLSVAVDPARSGYINRLNGPLSTANPGVEFQNAFVSLYASVLADPDVVLTTATIRKELSDTIKNNGSGNGGGYRIMISQDEVTGVTIGDVVTHITNEATGKVVDLMVHPYMPVGAAVIWSKSLPFPDSGVSNTVEFAAVDGADTLLLEWPVIQMTYDLSTYTLGSLLHYAPAWQGAILGIN